MSSLASPVSMLMTSKTCPMVVGIGEALFDCFRDQQVLGGAPINFVVHAHAILETCHGTAIPVTRVGSDPLGIRLTDELHKRGIDTSAIQVDDVHATGTVQVELFGAGQPEYCFPPNVAWDFIEYNARLVRLAKACHGVSYGTLAQRGPHSRRAIMDFLSTAKQAFRLFDVNLRQDFYSAGVVKDSLRLASAAKMNEDELGTVCELIGLECVGQRSVDHQAFALRSAFGLQWVAVTRGAQGMTLYAESDRIERKPPLLDRSWDADSIGAGDACGAGLLCGSLLGWPLDRMADFANQIGAFVASQPGATPRLPKDLLGLASEN